jgi:gas vesicle protein
MEEKMKSSEKNGKVTSIVAASIAGLLTGAALGMLFAPKSGKETREMIAAKAKALKERGKEVMH